MSTPLPPQPPAAAIPAAPSHASAAAPAVALQSPFVPWLLLALTVAGWFVFQTVHLWRERETLATARAAQDKPVEEARKIRTALDQLARGTAVLADKGNPNAKLIVDELRRRGITINPSSPPAN